MTTLLQVASHELRSPLSAVMGYASTLISYYDKLDDAEIRQYIAGIDNAAHQMDVLVTDLLTFSGITSGGLKLNLADVSLVDFLDRVLESHRITAPDHEYRLSIRQPDPRVRVDTVRLRQVMDNLLVNATKHGESPVLIGVSTRADTAVVRVTNQGPGVPNDSLERIFEPFVRIRTLARKQAQGSGLGLSVCKGIIETHGGAIWAERPNGGGFRITFTLPLKKPRLRPA
jgi:two-component system, OmpR family, sensor histidine kinase KdpD